MRTMYTKNVCAKGNTHQKKICLIWFGGRVGSSNIHSPNLSTYIKKNCCREFNFTNNLQINWNWAQIYTENYNRSLELSYLKNKKTVLAILPIYIALRIHIWLHLGIHKEVIGFEDQSESAYRCIRRLYSVFIILLPLHNQFICQNMWLHIKYKLT